MLWRPCRPRSCRCTIVADATLDCCRTSSARCTALAALCRLSLFTSSICLAERAIIAAAEKEKKAAAAAATSVQKATRGRQARDEMKAKQAAATSVQKATRGRLARTNSQRIRGGDKLE